jgi:hypothetical protein
MIILACISVIVSSALSVFYAYLAYKKSNEPPKDEDWETALKLCEGCEYAERIDVFASTYVTLKELRAGDCKDYGFSSFDAMRLFVHNECVTRREKNAGKLNNSQSLTEL